MLQPRKDVLREQLVLAAETIIYERRRRREYAQRWRELLSEAHHLRERLAKLQKPSWWHRFAWWRK